MIQTYRSKVHLFHPKGKEVPYEGVPGNPIVSGVPSDEHYLKGDYHLQIFRKPTGFVRTYMPVVFCSNSTNQPYMFP
jgi:hypothetical protein